MPLVENADEIYQPTPHLVAFVDALGFSEEIKKTANRVNEYFNIVDRVRTFLSQIDPAHTDFVKMTTIGDSVILAVEMPPTIESSAAEIVFIDRSHELYKAVAYLQAGMASVDIWTRGAITFGPLHFKENRIVGPAFTRAYFLEQTVAKYPRVILDGGVIRASGRSTCAEYRAISKIGQFFYNPSYFRATEVDLPRDVPTFIDFAPHSSQIRDKVTWIKDVSRFVAKHLQEDANHYAKYRWMGDYLLNYIMNEPVIFQDAEVREEVHRLLRDS